MSRERAADTRGQTRNGSADRCDRGVVLAAQSRPKASKTFPGAQCTTGPANGCRSRATLS